LPTNFQENEVTTGGQGEEELLNFLRGSISATLKERGGQKERNQVVTIATGNLSAEKDARHLTVVICIEQREKLGRKHSNKRIKLNWGRRRRIGGKRERCWLALRGARRLERVDRAELWEKNGKPSMVWGGKGLNGVQQKTGGSGIRGRPFAKVTRSKGQDSFLSEKQGANFSL